MRLGLAAVLGTALAASRKASIRLVEDAPVDEGNDVLRGDQVHDTRPALQPTVQFEVEAAGSVMQDADTDTRKDEVLSIRDAELGTAEVEALDRTDLDEVALPADGATLRKAEDGATPAEALLETPSWWYGVAAKDGEIFPRWLKEVNMSLKTDLYHAEHPTHVPVLALLAENRTEEEDAYVKEWEEDQAKQIRLVKEKRELFDENPTDYYWNYVGPKLWKIEWISPHNSVIHLGWALMEDLRHLYGYGAEWEKYMSGQPLPAYMVTAGASEDDYSFVEFTNAKSTWIFGEAEVHRIWSSKTKRHASDGGATYFYDENNVLGSRRTWNSKTCSRTEVIDFFEWNSMKATDLEIKKKGRREIRWTMSGTRTTGIPGLDEELRKGYGNTKILKKFRQKSKDRGSGGNYPI